MLDLTGVERQALARFTKDAGNHVAIEVHPPRRSRSRRAAPLRILFIADVVGTPGRKAVEERLPSLREELEVDFCIVNGENVADGVGITPKLADRLLAAGADAITLGNHVWRGPRSCPT